MQTSSVQTFPPLIFFWNLQLKGNKKSMAKQGQYQINVGLNNGAMARYIISHKEVIGNTTFYLWKNFESWQFTQKTIVQSYTSYIKAN